MLLTHLFNSLPGAEATVAAVVVVVLLLIVVMVVVIVLVLVLLRSVIMKWETACSWCCMFSLTQTFTKVVII